jgi:hypothetical protein
MDNHEEELFLALKEAHEAGARRGCLSTAILTESFRGNGADGWKSIQAAMNSIGGPHAPVLKTLFFIHRATQNITDINNIIFRAFENRHKVPGFGCSFIKGEPDPMLDKVKIIIENHYPKMNYILKEIESCVIKHKPVYPNLALYTAAYAIISRWPIPLIDTLFLKLRLDTWEMILIEQDNKTKLSDQ